MEFHSPITTIYNSTAQLHYINKILHKWYTNDILEKRYLLRSRFSAPYHFYNIAIFRKLLIISSNSCQRHEREQKLSSSSTYEGVDRLSPRMKRGHVCQIMRNYRNYRGTGAESVSLSISFAFHPRTHLCNRVSIKHVLTST